MHTILIALFYILQFECIQATDSCNFLKQNCPYGTTCDTFLEKCLHSPRQIGERCSDISDTTKCENGLICSTICQNCIPKDTLLTTQMVQASKYDSIKKRQTMLRSVKRCGVISEYLFNNFEDSITSNMPILYPETRTELISIVQLITKNGCKIRPVGATHSTYGIVTSALESNTVGISLARYQSSDKDWIDKVDIGNKRLRMCAGRSLFDAYALIRPHNLFLPTQTAGPIFTLGGITANSVHGGFYNKSYINSYITSLEVLTINSTEEIPTIKIITDPLELKHWRNSFGLLGLITGVEYMLEERNTFLSSTTGTVFQIFSRDIVNEYFDKLRENYIYSESFFNPYQKEILSVVFSEYPNECAGVMDVHCEFNFLKMQCENPKCCKYKGPSRFNLKLCFSRYPSKSKDELSKTYQSLSSQFSEIPYHGAPHLPADNKNLVCLLEELDSVNVFPEFVQDMIQEQFYKYAFQSIRTSVETNSGDVNDGFWLREVPNEYHLMAYSIPADKVYDLLLLLSEITSLISRETGIKFIPNIEMRFMSIHHETSTIMPTNAGLNKVIDGDYINCEMVINQYIGSTNDSWKRALYLFENRMRHLGGIVHTGKSFCYDDKDFEPFRDKSCVRSIFSKDQKDAFMAYRQKVDPLGVFFGGEAVHFF